MQGQDGRWGEWLVMRRDEVEKKLGVSCNTLRRWEREGRISAVRTQGKHRERDEVGEEDKRWVRCLFSHLLIFTRGLAARWREGSFSCVVGSEKQKYN